MALTVTQCGQISFSYPAFASGVGLQPSMTSAQGALSNTEGDWMIALLCWTSASTRGADTSVSFSVADDVHNWWEPAGAPSVTSGPAVIRVSCWVAPAAKAATTALVAPTGKFTDATAIFLNVHGMEPWMTIGGVTTHFVSGFTASGSLAISADSLVVTVAGVTGPNNPVISSGSGWTMTGSLASPGATSWVRGAYQEMTSGTASVSWQAAGGGFTNIAMLMTAIRVNGTPPAQPDQNWPATVAEIAPGCSISTSPDKVVWTPVTSRFLSAQMTQGRQFQLSALQGGAGTIKLDNPDGALEPPGTGAFAGIDSGTPFRIRTAWQGGQWQVQWTGNGVAGAPGIRTPSGTFTGIVPGRTYTASMWVGSSDVWSFGMTIRIDWFNGSGGLISESISGTISTTPPSLASVTGIAPGGAVSAVIICQTHGVPPSSITFSAAAAYGTGSDGYLTVPPGVIWGVQNSSAITQLLPFTPSRLGPPVITPWGIPMSGFIQQWPQQWDTTTLRGFTEAVTSDAFGYLTANLQPILMQEILNDVPYAYWPCTDAAGSSAASNIAPGNGNPLNVVLSKYGTSGATEAFGQNGSALLGAQGSVPITSSVRVASSAGMWGQTVPTATFAPQYGFSLSCTDISFPAVSSGFSVEMWFQWQGPAVTQYGPTVLAIASNGPFPGNQWLIVSMQSAAAGPPNPGSLWLAQALSFQKQLSTTDFFNATVPTQLVITITGSQWTAYLNGQVATTGTLSSPPGEFISVNAGGQGILMSQFLAVSDAWNFAFSGFIGHVAVFPYILTQARVNTHYQAGAAGMAGESASSRIERLLQATPFGGRRAIVQDQGNAVTQVVSCQDIAGQPANASLNNISASTVPGQLWNVPNGDLFYQARSLCWNQQPRWTIGNRPDLGEIPLGEGVVFGYDPLRVVNSVQITQLDNQDVVTPGSSQLLAIIAASKAQYGTLSYWVTGYLENDIFSAYNAGPSTEDLANWVAATNAKPLLRLSAVAIMSAPMPYGWQFFTQAAPGDTVQVTYRPPTGAGAGVSLTVTGRISQTGRQMSFGIDGSVTGTITVLIDPMPEGQVLTVDDPVLGQLNGVNRLAW